MSQTQSASPTSLKASSPADVWTAPIDASTPLAKTHDLAPDSRPHIVPAGTASVMTFTRHCRSGGSAFDAEESMSGGTGVALVGVNAADDLVGQTLPGGWEVIEKVVPGPNATGGRFSINYWVKQAGGRRGFCKVLNYHWMLNSSGLPPAQAMLAATAAYEFERDLARDCAGLSRVVTAIDDGEFTLPGYAVGAVSFIIFEEAGKDVRQVLDASADLDHAFRLRVLHHVATGLKQLHGLGIAHQDVKPSNVMVSSVDVDGRRDSKVGDLGRANATGRPALHDDAPIAGDPSYAPPEQLYKAVPSEFGLRRLGCDLYQLGGLTCFVFTGVTMNGLLKLELHPDHHWTVWSGTYADVLPYVTDAFGRAIERVRAAAPPTTRIRPGMPTNADRLALLVSSLCQPDPALRGFAGRARVTAGQHGLDRVVTELDLMCRQVEVELGVIRR